MHWEEHIIKTSFLWYSCHSKWCHSHHEETTENHTFWDTLQNNWLVLFKSVKDMKEKDWGNVTYRKRLRRRTTKWTHCEILCRILEQWKDISGKVVDIQIRSIYNLVNTLLVLISLLFFFFLKFVSVKKHHFLFIIF